MSQTQEHPLIKLINPTGVQDLKALRLLHLQELPPNQHFYREQDVETDREVWGGV
jgi:hypothetical protein